jgi:hypothetical protein
MRRPRPAWRRILFAVEAALILGLLAWAAIGAPLMQLLDRL